PPGSVTIGCDPHHAYAELRNSVSVTRRASNVNRDQPRTSTVSKSALAITEEHNDLADSTFGQLNRLNSRAAARATLEDGSAHPTDVWSAAAEGGWLGLAVAEDHGGSGFGLAELAVVLEAQGHELCPGPFLPSAAAAVVIDRCAPESV